MDDIAKYVLGVAAKSNVQKRQVGCVIIAETLVNGKYTKIDIVGEGYNSSEFHAEYLAVEDMLTREDVDRDLCTLKAYVSHQPCPDCAKTLALNGVYQVVLVDNFMKFDSDKLRYDLIDSTCLLDLIYEFPPVYGPYEGRTVKKLLYECNKGVAPMASSESALRTALFKLAQTYSTTQELEDALARVLTHGASKYKPNNWRNCQDTGRYLAAAHRHNNAIIAGQEVDPDSGFNHRDHILTNLMFIYVLGHISGETHEEQNSNQ